MLIWSGLLFFLGILAFVDSMFNMGQIFRQVNSVMFLLISLALFIRTTTKAKEGKLEDYRQRVFSLERQVQSLKASQEKLNQF